MAAATFVLALRADIRTSGVTLAPWEVGFAINSLLLAMWLSAMIRFGFFAAATTSFFLFLLTNFPVAIRWSDWFVAQPVLLWGLVAAVALYGFRTAVGRTAFSAVLKE